MPNPLLDLLFHAIGRLSAGSFYAALERRTRPAPTHNGALCVGKNAKQLKKVATLMHLPCQSVNII